MTFVAEHRGETHGGRRWGVESICAVLTASGAPIAPSTYYDAIGRTPSNRQRRDRLLQVEILRIYEANGRVWGARRIWRQLNVEGVPVARCTVERLMPRLAASGGRRGRPPRSGGPRDQPVTAPHPGQERP